MRLTRITLGNIGPFCGEHSLELDTPRDTNSALHLVGGRNGSGKTTILESLYLLWYGSRSPYVKRTQGGWPIYRANLIHNKATGPARIYVELEAALSREQTSLQVELSWDHPAAPSGPMYRVRRGDVVDSLLSQRWPAFAEELLPLALAPLFWSDGEHIAAALDNQALDTSFSAAVRTVLGLNITTPLLDALGQIVSKTADESGEHSSAEGLSQHQQEITSLEMRRRLIVQEVAAARARLRYVSKENVSVEEAYPTDVHNDRLTPAMDLKRSARGPLALLPLVPLLERAYPWVQATVTKNREHPDGTAFLLDARDLQLVRSFLRELAPGIAANAKESLTQCALPEGPLTVETTPEGGGEEQPRVHQRRLARLEAESQAINEQLKRTHQARRRLIDDYGRSQRSEGIQGRKLDIAVRVLDVLHKFSAGITRQRLHVLEQRLNAALQVFAYKGDHLGRLRVDPEAGQILLVSDADQPVPIQHLSAGEQQLLLLVMMWGLRQASGLAAPLLMDTLLARLDLEHRGRLLKVFQQPNDGQVIMFATDGEVGPEDVDTISTAALHLLDYSIDTQESRIHRGRYFGCGEESQCFQRRSP